MTQASTERAPLGDITTSAQLNPVPRTENSLQKIPESSTKTAETAKAGDKRSASDDVDKYSWDDVEYYDCDQNCDQIRRKINTFIDNGGMKVGEFQKAISANSKSYYSFMQQRGPYKGANSSVYQNAWTFFKLRELNGKKMPKKTKPAAEKNSSTNQGTPANASAGNAAKSTESVLEKDLAKIANIKLAGEDGEAVPIFDNCNEVRRKLNLYLKHDGVTQAAFCRTLTQQLGSDQEHKTLQGRQLGVFRGHKGPNGGAKSPVFYAAYVFFEKIRLANGKDKSAHRRGMEEEWGAEGMPRTIDSKTKFWTLKSEKPHLDKFGKVHFG